MKSAKIFLGLTGLIFAVYGVYLIINPQFLIEIANFSISENTALTELRAMYGGLQLALGLFMLISCSRESLITPCLLLMVLSFLCLSGTRALGLVIDPADNGYNVSAMLYECSES
jgi:hypothetical protein